MGMPLLKMSKRSKIMGLPIGRKRFNWTKAAMMGIGAASSVAGGLRARRASQEVSEKVSDSVSQGKEALDNVSSASEQAGSVGQAMSGASSPLGKVAAAVKSVGGGEGEGGGGGKGRNVKKLRMIIKESVEVGVPRKVAYNQWTQFAEMPSIVKGVHQVDQQEDDVTRWTAKIGPSRRSWTAEIVEQTPDEKIVWRSKEGVENRGVVSFHSLDSNLTRVQVEMEYFPTGLIEKTGNIFLVARRRVRKDLRLFKHFIELAGEETGSWRGEISKDEEEEQRAEGQQDRDQEQGDQEQGDQKQGDQKQRDQGDGGQTNRQGAQEQGKKQSGHEGGAGRSQGEGRESGSKGGSRSESGQGDSGSGSDSGEGAGNGSQQRDREKARQS